MSVDTPKDIFEAFVEDDDDDDDDDEDDEDDDDDDEPSELDPFELRCFLLLEPWSFGLFLFVFEIVFSF